MSRDEVIWTMISELLVDYYLPANVFNAYQNDFTVPKTNEYIIINKKIAGQKSLPHRKFDYLTQTKIIEGNGGWEYQVDLYGPNADSAMDNLHLYLISPEASNYLFQYEQGIGAVRQPLNLSPVNDRDKYMNRFMIYFTALNISRLAIPCPGIALNDIEVTFKEIT